MAMSAGDPTRAVFGELRGLGVSIATDDFGTGRAGISYLRKPPFGRLKTDRKSASGVEARTDSQAICGERTALAKWLTLNVLAEGTRTQAEVRSLRELHACSSNATSSPAPSRRWISPPESTGSLSAMAMASRTDRGTGLSPSAA